MFDEQPDGDPHGECAAEIAWLRAALTTACERMDRARGILTDDNPRPDCNWGMLDTSDLTPNVID